MLFQAPEPLYGHVISFGPLNNFAIWVIIENSICGALYNCKTLSRDTSFQGHVHMCWWWLTAQPSGGTTWRSLGTRCCSAVPCLGTSGSLQWNALPAFSRCWSAVTSHLPQEDNRARWLWKWGQAQAAWSLGEKGSAGLVTTAGLMGSSPVYLRQHRFICSCLHGPWRCQSILTMQNLHPLELRGILLPYFSSLVSSLLLSKRTILDTHPMTLPTQAYRVPSTFFFSWNRLFLRGEREGKGVVCFIKRNQATEQSILGIQLSFISPVRVSLPSGSLPQACSWCSVHPPTHVLS